MEGLIPLVVVAIVVAVVSHLIVKGRSAMRRDPALPEGESGSRVRMSEQQLSALMAAADGTIYAENPSFRDAQMPGGGRCFALRTVESLVKRGYVVADGKGGYVITPEGEQGIRAGLGSR
jgi:hypothetical protein